MLLETGREGPGSADAGRRKGVAPLEEVSSVWCWAISSAFKKWDARWRAPTSPGGFWVGVGTARPALHPTLVTTG